MVYWICDTCHLSGFLSFPNLILVFSFQTCQPIQTHFPLACTNSLNFYKCLLWDFACVCTATQLTFCLCLFSHTANSLFPPVDCLFKITQMQYAISAILFGTFLIDYEKYSWLWHCTTTWEILSPNPSRVLGTFTATYSFCLHSVAVRSNQPNRNEYVGISLGVKCGQCVELTTLPS